MAKAKIKLTAEREHEIIDLIVERYRRRVAWHKAEKTLTLQGRAICRRLCDGDKDDANALFDKIAALKPEQIAEILAGFTEDYPEDIIAGVHEVFPILLARHTIETHREVVEKELERLAKMLPIAAWVEESAQSGFSYGSLAAIIGSAGNLHNYPRESKLWKRLGLALIGNIRQQPLRDREAALIHGYSPARRSVMWVIGASILRTQTARVDKETGEIKRESGYWRSMYDARKKYEQAKNEAGDYAEQAARRLSEAKFDKKTSAFKAYSEGKLPPLHIHARAQRYIEKALLKELWTQWRLVMTPPAAVAPVEAPAEKEPALAA